MFLRDTKTTHIAQNLKEYRISHNLKQTEMADLLKMIPKWNAAYISLLLTSF